MIRKFHATGIAILFFGLFAAACYAGQEGGVTILTMDDAIAMALKNNRDVLIARENLAKAAQQIREARSSAFPEINVDNVYTRTIQKPAFFLAFGDQIQKIEIGTDNSVQSSLTVKQLLYSGGKVGTAVKIAKLYSSSLAELVTQTEKNTKLQVRQQFLTILLTREVLAVNRQNLELARAHEKRVKTLFSRGVASEFDVLRAEVQAANALPQVISGEKDIELQKNVLKNLIGMPLDRELEIRGKLVPQFVDSTIIGKESADILARRGDYRNLELTRDALAGNIKIERSNWLPELTLNYNYTFQGQSNEEFYRYSENNRVHSQYTSLNLTFPLFDGFRTAARVQQAEIGVRTVDYQLMKLRESISIQVSQALNKMDDARKRSEALATTVEQARKAYSIARVRYDSGQGTQLDLFDAQVALEAAQLNTLQSYYDYEVARAQWENAVGL